jgi:hypothetical protein
MKMQDDNDPEIENIIKRKKIEKNIADCIQRRIESASK